ncbi:MAG: NAD(P)H-hydrate dehydratase [Chlamydiia bacterium]|nr:NAD(P)H-hydrate dehydratase [Chlamydiia bacterium]
MKVITAKKMAQLEQQAYSEGYSEENFMEEAGSGVALVVHDFIEWTGHDKTLYLLCGKGNNAGDAYVAGIHLLHLDYEIVAYQLFPEEACSPLCTKNIKRFIAEGGIVHYVHSIQEVQFVSDGVIIDGLLGTGFSGKLKGLLAEVVKKANYSPLPVISIDIPTGLDGTTGVVDEDAIEATTTAFLGFPKLGFFLNDGWNFSGSLEGVDFGLPHHLVDHTQPDLLMLEPTQIKKLIPKNKRSQHKYEAGYVTAIAGSKEMPGAAILTTLSSLRAGAGIVRLYHPQDMQPLIVSTPPEILKTSYDSPEDLIAKINQSDAVIIGPGIGISSEKETLLSTLVPQLSIPCLLDADALTLYAQNPFPLPQNVVMTPHHGELKRLLKLESVDLIDSQLLNRCQEFASDLNVTLVVKGGPTFIFQKNLTPSVNPTGDPGMATAGSGDVLSGLIGAFLSRKLSCYDAARLGVYLHGLAGEHAAQDLGSACMIASDILNYFPLAFSFEVPPTEL